MDLEIVCFFHGGGFFLQNVLLSSRINNKKEEYDEYLVWPGANFLPPLPTHSGTETTRCSQNIVIITNNT
jgi:hypothetical protein